jgi:hypothetical protein
VVHGIVLYLELQRSISVYYMLNYEEHWCDVILHQGPHVVEDSDNFLNSSKKDMRPLSVDVTSGEIFPEKYSYSGELSVKETRVRRIRRVVLRRATSEETQPPALTVLSNKADKASNPPVNAINT